MSLVWVCHAYNAICLCHAIHLCFLRIAQTQLHSFSVTYLLAARLTLTPCQRVTLGSTTARHVTHRDRIKESSLVRQQRLAESLQLQRFLRNIYESETWLGEKMQVACDESYRDPSNLQSKIQKHQAFEAELQANAGRVLAVNQVGRAYSDLGLGRR